MKHVLHLETEKPVTLDRLVHVIDHCTAKDAISDALVQEVRLTVGDADADADPVVAACNVLIDHLVDNPSPPNFCSVGSAALLDSINSLRSDLQP